MSIGHRKLEVYIAEKVRTIEYYKKHIANTITGRYDRSPYERAWWTCQDEDCKEYMMLQAFYVGEHKHGQRWNP